MVFSFVDIFHYVLFNWVAYRELRIHLIRVVLTDCLVVTNQEDIATP